LGRWSSYPLCKLNWQWPSVRKMIAPTIGGNVKPPHAYLEKRIYNFLEIVQKNNIWCTFKNNIELFVDELVHEHCHGKISIPSRKGWRRRLCWADEW
jgi:hypothetical protein